MTENRDARNIEFVSQTGRTLLTLRELLLKGEYRPGERLSELALVARLGVSRTPIRLALDRLAHEGLLEPSPSGGFTVREFTLEDIWDAIDMRGVLEGSAARLAAERLQDPSELLAIREVQRQMDTIANNTFESFAQYMQLNGEFHAAVVTLAKSPMLTRTLSHLTSLPFAGSNVGVFSRATAPRAKEFATIGQEHHHAILEALEKRQGTRAESIAREHAQLSRKNLESVLLEGGFASFLPGASLVRVDSSVV